MSVWSTQNTGLETVLATFGSTIPSKSNHSSTYHLNGSVTNITGSASNHNNSHTSSNHIYTSPSNSYGVWSKSGAVYQQKVKLILCIIILVCSIIMRFSFLISVDTYKLY